MVAFPSIIEIQFVSSIVSSMTTLGMVNFVIPETENRAKYASSFSPFLPFHFDEFWAHFSSQKVTKDRERYEAIRDCRYVDKVIPDIPWGYDESFFNKYKIDFLCHDDLPYGIGCKDGALYFKNNLYL